MRRWLWLVLGGTVGFALAQMFNLSLTLSFILVALLLLTVAAGLAFSSWSRHSGDFEARGLWR